MRRISSKIVSLENLSSLCDSLKASGKKIVSTNGCFDILHLGHLQYLEKARELGDVLICAVNSDASVKLLKGPSRPIHSEAIRAQQLASLESVDYVVIFTESTPEAILEKIRPHFHVKGGDYDPEKLPERAIVEKHGGKVVCVPFTPGFSTSHLIEKLKT